MHARASPELMAAGAYLELNGSKIAPLALSVGPLHMELPAHGSFGLSASLRLQNGSTVGQTQHLLVDYMPRRNELERLHTLPQLRRSASAMALQSALQARATTEPACAGSVAIIGYCNVDGQVMAWQQLMSQLLRHGWRVTYVVEAVATPAQMAFCAELEAWLKERGGALIRSTIRLLAETTVNEPECPRGILSNSETACRNALARKFNAAFDDAGGRLEAIEPPSLREGWRGLAEQWASVEADVLIASNTMGDLDHVTSRLARLLRRGARCQKGTHSRAGTPHADLAASPAPPPSSNSSARPWVLMDMNNLAPVRSLQLDTLVTPSRFARAHASVAPYAARKPAFVLPPGVDAAAWGPGLWPAAAPPLPAHPPALSPQPRTRPPLLTPAALHACMRGRLRRLAAHQHASVGVLARLELEKGLGLVVEALARMPRWVGGGGRQAPRAQRVQLEVVGGGSLRSPLQALCVARGVHCVFHGKVVGERLRELVRGWSAAVIGLHYPETWGLAGLEAMAAGVPVVTVGTGGTGEYVVHGANGIVLPSLSAKPLAAALTELLAARATSAQLGCVGSWMTQHAFSTDMFAGRYMRLLSALAQTWPAEP